AVGDLLISAIEGLRGTGGAGVVAVLSLAGAVWSASGYVGGFMKASNIVYDIPEGRPFWKTIPVRLAVTVVSLAGLAASVVAVVVSGSLAREIGEALGLGSQAVTVWNSAKWPVRRRVLRLPLSLIDVVGPNSIRLC